MDHRLERIQEIIGYRFKNPQLLKIALTHRSLVNEALAEDLQDNERFEFLGDAILGMVTAEWLMEEFTDLKEGDLTRLRSNLVKEGHLAKIARRWGVGSCLYMGKGEAQMKGMEKDSLLANAFEAIIAAMYLDGGLEVVRQTIRIHFQEIVSNPNANLKSLSDPKTRIQELCTSLLRTQPLYNVIGEIGPDHQKIFCVELCLFSRRQALGRGRSKKDAEQEAAANLLERLKNNPFSLL